MTENRPQDGTIPPGAIAAAAEAIYLSGPAHELTRYKPWRELAMSSREAGCRAATAALTAALPAIEAAIRAGEQDRACTCGPWHPDMDGPEETCPQHGRRYADWIERGDVLQAQNDAMRAVADVLQAQNDAMQSVVEAARAYMAVQGGSGTVFVGQRRDALLDALAVLDGAK